MKKLLLAVPLVCLSLVALIGTALATEIDISGRVFNSGGAPVGNYPVQISGGDIIGTITLYTDTAYPNVGRFRYTAHASCYFPTYYYTVTVAQESRSAQVVCYYPWDTGNWTLPGGGTCRPPCEFDPDGGGGPTSAVQTGTHGTASTGGGEVSGDDDTPNRTRVGPTAPGGLVVRSVGPNPFRDRVQLVVAAPAGGALVTGGVFDVRGRLVQAFEPRAIGEGNAVFAWDGRMASGASAPAGVYFVRLFTARSQTLSRVALVH